jgi:hypothetical protein
MISCLIGSISLLFPSFSANSTLWLAQQSANCEKKFYEVVDQNEDYQKMVYANKEDDLDDRQPRPKRSRTDTNKETAVEVREEAHRPASVPKPKPKPVSPAKSSTNEDKSYLILHLQTLQQILGKLESSALLLNCNNGTKETIIGYSSILESNKEAMALVAKEMSIIQTKILPSFK